MRDRIVTSRPCRVFSEIKNLPILRVEVSVDSDNSVSLVVRVMGDRLRVMGDRLRVMG